MKCTSCLVEIPPTFLAAIRSGVCPSCNGQIMPPEFKLIYDEIRKTMSQMPNDPDGLAGWLLSNYHLEKIDPEKEVEPAKFYYPKQAKNKPLKSQKLTKQQQYYNQDFDPEVDLEKEEQEIFDTSENEFFKKAGVNRSASETEALIRKAKQGKTEEWDPDVLRAITSLKPEINNYNEENDFSTYENDYPIQERTNNMPAPKSAQEILIRNNNSRNAFAENGRSFKSSR